jgi:hypothetical protein
LFALGVGPGGIAGSAPAAVEAALGSGPKLQLTPGWGWLPKLREWSGIEVDAMQRSIPLAFRLHQPSAEGIACLAVVVLWPAKHQ